MAFGVTQAMLQRTARLHPEERPPSATGTTPTVSSMLEYKKRTYEDDLLAYMELQKKSFAPSVPRKVDMHPRAACPIFAFDAETGFHNYCPQCICFVCEVPASECPYWTSHDHCQASYRSVEWQTARDRAHHGLPPVMRQAKSRPASLVHRRRIQNVSIKTTQRELMKESVEERKERYRRATEDIGAQRLNKLERDLREKVFNRVAAGPFQLRRNFKYFDKNSDGTIDLDEFFECLEYLMGVILPEEHAVALFARYDADANGEMDYREFIEQLMGEQMTAPTRRESRSVDIINNLRRPKVEPPEFTIPPHHPLFGSEKASLASCSKSIMPKQRPKPMPSYETRVFRAKFANPSVQDELRRFEITLYLDDNTVSIYEPIQKNTGVIGGRFLSRTEGPVPAPEGRTLGVEDFKPGATLNISGRPFFILNT